MAKHYKNRPEFRSICLVAFYCLILGVIILSGCGGGGGGGGDAGGGGDGGGDSGLVYVGSTAPADMTAANATRLLNQVFGAGDLGDSIPVNSLSISAATPFSESVSTRLVSYELRDVLMSLGSETPPAAPFSKEAVDETFQCFPSDSSPPSGSYTVNGNLDDQDGTGTLTITFNNCQDGDTFLSGVIRITIDEATFSADTWYPARATLTFDETTMISPQMDILMDGSMQYRLNPDWSETMTLNVVLQDNDTGRMQKAENFVITSGYVGTYLSEEISGRLYDSLYGYIDVATEQELHFDDVYSLFPFSGIVGLTGSGGSRLRATVLSETMVLIELDLNGDTVYETSGEIPWEVILTAGTDPGDADGDGLDDDWEDTYGLNPSSYADAGADTDGDGLGNFEEFTLGTSPVSSDSDSDEMPDGWEVDYGFDPTDDGDAGLDLDGDNATNRMEYTYGTDPTDSFSTPADLQASKSVSMETVSSGTLFQYALEITNHGPGMARGVELTDTLPEGTEVYTVVPDILPAYWDCELSGGSFACWPWQGTMAAGESVTIDVPVVAPAELGSITNSVEIDSTTHDYDAANNTDEADAVVDSAVLTQVDVAVDGEGGVDGLGMPFKLAISPDGKHIYVPGTYDDAVAVFERDLENGTLAFVEAESGGIDTPGWSFSDFPKAAAVSPDGKNVYVTKEWSHELWVGAVVAYSRDSVNGALDLIEEYTDLGFSSPTYSIAISGDGANVYVTVPNESAVVVLDRDAGTGALSFNMAVENGVDYVTGMEMPFDLALSPDDKFLYVAGSGSIVIFSRSLADGTLTYAGVLNGVDGQLAIAASADGEHLYATGSVLTVLSRDSGSGLLTPVATYANGEDGIVGLEGMYDVAVAPDGGYVYVAAQYDNSLGVFARDSDTGALRFIEVQKDGIGGVDGLGVCWAAAVSPDSAFVYVSGASDNAIGAFSVDLAADR